VREALLGMLAGSTANARTSQPTQAWERAARRRRFVLLLAVIASAMFATARLAHVALPQDENGVLWGIQIVLFGLLFAWVSAGFFTALMGYWVMRRGDRYAMSASQAGHDPIDSGARTAIVMPICNEQVSTVFAGLRATWESLQRTGSGALFDVFVLSDTSDPQTRLEELSAWQTLQRELGSQCRIFYRLRQRRTKRKAGNVADFCRRWGRDYRYMVVLDADSVMSGDSLVTLVRLMERNPRAGILQSAPQTCGLTTVHARSQQFASRVAGRLFTAGMQFWQLGESHYWGHNAIIRVAPFMKHCALAPLAGRGGLAGEILSHDFVEAALMRRAGYQVWVVQDLVGSYEQQPPNLLEELKRDRRWCQGNLQNARLIAEPGLHGVHRAMFLTGAMAYLSAPMWLAFVIVSTGIWLWNGVPALPAVNAAALASGASLLPHAVRHIAPLWLATAVMLMLPRVLGVLVIVQRGEAPAYGGTRALVLGTLMEAGLSTLQAPVRMVAHSMFVFVALTGIKLEWRSPPREANDVLWSEAAERFGWMSVAIGTLVTIGVAQHLGALIWLAPVAVPLMLSVPLVVLTSRVSLGRALRSRGLLITPEELRAPAVLRRAWMHAKRGIETTSVPALELAPLRLAA
jgi:membrane glycosyltransferase